jgi:catechol 2,3-dioxygenase-like lactoylglutathione lyase family enzyme
MGQLRAFDHVGITVADLDAATAFFVGLGLEVEGRTFVEGEFIDTVCGIPDSRTEIVMLRPPGGGTAVELSSFVRPDHRPGSPSAMANELGLRSIAFEVDDLQAAVDRLAADGYSSAVSVNTRTPGSWPTYVVRQGSSWPSPSASAERRFSRSGLAATG